MEVELYFVIGGLGLVSGCLSGLLSIGGGPVGRKVPVTFGAFLPSLLD